MSGDGSAIPWVDLEAFARKAIELACRDRALLADAHQWIFFDRGLIDAAVALEHATGIAVSDTIHGLDRFHHQVFLTPPWPEIYRTDRERQHDIEQGIEEYHRLLLAFDKLGYETIILPKVSVEARADFILDQLLRL
jgi:predicted ATPase